eukprot:2128279-Amphidinium_carterae.1
MQHDFITLKVEDVSELTGQEYFADEYFAEEAAKEDDIDNDHYKASTSITVSMSWASTNYSSTADNF